jgi:hypothetical protein
MIARMRVGLGGITGIIVVVGAMWMWTRAPEIALLMGQGMGDSALQVWCVRCAAISAAAMAQLSLLGGVVEAFYPPRAGQAVLRLVVEALAAGAAVAAAGFAFVGR